MFAIRFRLLRLFLGTATVSLAAMAIPDAAHAAERLSAADRSAIERVIRDQLDAFGEDDAPRAFGHATPDIQQMFGTPDDFMDMVRENYAPVYRSDGLQFLGLEARGSQWVQTVQLVDDEGRVWRALFTMRRQPDRSWKVGGCQLVQTSAIAS